MNNNNIIISVPVEHEDRNEVKVEALPEYGSQYDDLISFGIECLEESDGILSITNRLYMLTMKPLDVPYENSRIGKSRFDFHKEGISKGVCKLRKFKVTQYVASTEKYACKIHQNFIFRCKDLAIMKEHDKIWYNKWKIYCQPLKGSVYQALSYIYKEALKRPFHLYWDYIQSYKGYSVALSRPKAHGAEVDEGTSVAHPHRDPGDPSSECNEEDFNIDLN